MKAIFIIGGGISGLVTGIALRQHGIAVTVVEAGFYPRHKVCGEFLNGAGIDLLEALEIPLRKFAASVETISFHRGEKSSQTSALPNAGVAIPRFSFDKLLALNFEVLGGKLKCGTRYRAHSTPEGYVQATGRRLRRPAKWKWYGVKAHARNVRQKADLELHLVENGYIGLCRLDAHRSNICGLFRRPVANSERSADLLEHFTRPNSLRDRLAGAEWVEESIATVSGLPVPESDPPESFSVGDAFGMIPPFTGNGMSIAIELGMLGAGILKQYAEGNLSWGEAAEGYHRAGEELVRKRMFAANLSQKLLLSPICQRLFMATADRTNVWGRVFEATR